MTPAVVEPPTWAGAALRVRLLSATDRPSDTAVAAAMSCYRPDLVTPEEAARHPARDSVAKRTRQAGHTTTLQHAHFHFALEGVSRLALWTFLHDHPFYNSEQVSQRYVPVDVRRVHVPPLSEEGRAVFLAAVAEAGRTYERLRILLARPARRAFAERFPARRLDEPRWRAAIAKKAQEAARYVLPVATTAHLHHTISALTLIRYRRMASSPDALPEIRALVAAMCAEAERFDPSIFRFEVDPPPVAIPVPDGPAPDAWFDEFDARLGRRVSVLIDASLDPEEVVARAVRNILGLPRTSLRDAEAIALALDPARNHALAETIGLGHHDRISRALLHVRFGFAKRLSLAADSQNQRHRLVAGARPILARHLRPHRPDYVIPALVRESAEAEEVYRTFMEGLWESIRRLLEIGEAVSSAIYLLPNAFAVRFEESGDLAALRHKWAMRLCLNAQEEIWRATVDEVEQVRARWPLLGRYLLAPCGVRARAGTAPPCPEGPAYCGVPLWRVDVADVRRTI